MNALTSILQRMALEDAPDRDALRLSLLTHALKRGVWLLGFAFMVGSFLFQAGDRCLNPQLVPDLELAVDAVACGVHTAYLGQKPHIAQRSRNSGALGTGRDLELPTDRLDPEAGALGIYEGAHLGRDRPRLGARGPQQARCWPG
jgi:hypothetical protein